jgi:hypothetical protein
MTMEQTNVLGTARLLKAVIVLQIISLGLLGYLFVGGQRIAAMYEAEMARYQQATKTYDAEMVRYQQAIKTYDGEMQKYRERSDRYQADLEEWKRLHSFETIPGGRKPETPEPNQPANATASEGTSAAEEPPAPAPAASHR